MSKYVCALDVGTTGAKAMIVDKKGNILGKGYREYELEYPKPNHVEIRASLLIDMSCEVIKTAIENSGISNEEIGAISFSVQRSSFALLDENLNVLDDTYYVWIDSRSQECMEEIDSLISPERRNALTGLPGAAIFGVARFYWIKKFLPETYAKTKYYATSMTFLMNAFGSDDVYAEVSDAAVQGLIDVNTLEWSKDIIDALGYDAAKFPKLCKAGDIVGGVSEEMAARTGLKAGTKIVAGSGDQQLSVMGAGLVDDGDVVLNVGTYSMVAVGLAKPNFEALFGLMAPPTPAIDVFQVEGGQTSGATCYRWCRDTLCADDVKDAEAMGVDPYVLMADRYIDQSVPGSHGLIFYSALFGSGYPTWDASATSFYVGLRSTTNKADMVRAVMEGVTLESRHMLENLEGTGVAVNDVMVVAGGASKSPQWCQIIADIFNKKIRTCKVTDTALIGTAGVAFIGLGEFGSVREAIENMVELGDIVEPIPENVAVYDKVFKVYKESYFALKGVEAFNQLAEVL